MNANDLFIVVPICGTVLTIALKWLSLRPNNITRMEIDTQLGKIEVKINELKKNDTDRYAQLTVIEKEMGLLQKVFEAALKSNESIKESINKQAVMLAKVTTTIESVQATLREIKENIKGDTHDIKRK